MAAPLLAMACTAAIPVRESPVKLSAGDAHSADIAPKPFCEVRGTAVRTNFEGAAVFSCSTGADGPVLVIAPEYSPINPSPWYAYRVETGQAGVVTLTHVYRGGKHRYAPWISANGEDWQLLPEDSVVISDGGYTVMFTVEIPEGGALVAAQPLLSHVETARWIHELAAKRNLTSKVVAESSGGRTVELYSTQPEDSAGLVVLIGRQHPPEVTGAFAFRDFAERLLESDPLADAFRRHFVLALVPMVNPDGVARGHWRTNRQGVDLNRDWGPFTQAETRGIANWIAEANQVTPLALFLDFHSTWFDVFYSQHPEDRPTPAGFDTAWRDAMAARLGDDMPAWSGAHNPGLPTAKSWARKHYGVTAITYEVADTTPLDAIRHKARIAAEEMMKVLLQKEALTQ